MLVNCCLLHSSLWQSDNVQDNTSSLIKNAPPSDFSLPLFMASSVICCRWFIKYLIMNYISTRKLIGYEWIVLELSELGGTEAHCQKYNHYEAEQYYQVPLYPQDFLHPPPNFR